jgi:hypothetical protein
MGAGMSHDIPQRGKIAWDEEEKTWWLTCPNCGQTGELEPDQEVTWNDGVPTISGSIICECGDHYHITNGMYQKAG